jgi:ATP-dependent Lon protease
VENRGKRHLALLLRRWRDRLLKKEVQPMKRDTDGGEQSSIPENVPDELPILPIRNSVIYPFSIQPLVVGVPRSVKLIEDASSGDRFIGLLAAKDSSLEEPGPDQVYETGTVGRILRVLRSPDGQMHVVVQGIERFMVDRWLHTEPYLKAAIRLRPEESGSGPEDDALQRSLLEIALEVISLSPNIPKEATAFLNNIHDPRLLIYLVLSNLQMELEEGQRILEMDDLKEKMRALITRLTREKEVLSIGREIKTRAEEEMGKAQREYLLRQQLKAIQNELGELNENQEDAADYAKKIEDAKMSEEAQKEAGSELKRLSSMPPQAAEYSMVKSYLDWMVELPWSVLSEDQLDIENARKVLDEDHYDLRDVKDRIIEYLAVRKITVERGLRENGKSGEGAGERKAMGAILCFVGPPGVGKTSLGQSIARALGRKFTRMSLGGVRDEAEIRGHRRTYIGSMPGRIIQAIKRVGTRNPVFMLDEVDKVGADWRGDPSSALLELLDPAQNHSFRDNYLNVDFDLSDVIFIATANQLEPIPPPLRDRMEIIHLDGYTEYEKIRIAQDHLVPRQREANGIRSEEVSFTDQAIHKIIQDYTREAGVRNLERQIGAVCRKCVVRIASGETDRIQITPELVSEYLKKEIYELEHSEAVLVPGIATGLAVTAVGGEILFIEATRMEGKGDFTLTGQLGDVMRESARIAHSYVRSKGAELGVDPGEFSKHDVHIHVPAGAIPKDGPSAGVAMVLALASLFSGKPVRSDVGMTGEITLRGRVMPVGGIKMKILAAHRSGLGTVILPKRNERDLDEIPEDVRNEMRFILVERIDEALEAALSAGASRERESARIA